MAGRYRVTCLRGPMTAFQIAQQFRSDGGETPPKFLSASLIRQFGQAGVIVEECRSLTAKPVLAFARQC